METSGMSSAGLMQCVQFPRGDPPAWMCVTTDLGTLVKGQSLTCEVRIPVVRVIVNY
jgi:hypothetical protein